MEDEKSYNLMSQPPIVLVKLCCIKILPVIMSILFIKIVPLQQQDENSN